MQDILLQLAASLHGVNHDKIIEIKGLSTKLIRIEP
tara:strand:- start:347606 stop:347713 length:108 start_codon:yes stop_codon:yes gene_type:complete